MSSALTSKMMKWLEPRQQQGFVEPTPLLAEGEDNGRKAGAQIVVCYLNRFTLLLRQNNSIKNNHLFLDRLLPGVPPKPLAENHLNPTIWKHFAANMSLAVKRHRNTTLLSFLSRVYTVSFPGASSCGGSQACPAAAMSFSFRLSFPCLLLNASCAWLLYFFFLLAEMAIMLQNGYSLDDLPLGVPITKIFFWMAVVRCLYHIFWSNARADMKLMLQEQRLIVQKMKPVFEQQAGYRIEYVHNHDENPDMAFVHFIPIAGAGRRPLAPGVHPEAQEAYVAQSWMPLEGTWHKSEVSDSFRFRQKGSGSLFFFKSLQFDGLHNQAAAKHQRTLWKRRWYGAMPITEITFQLSGNVFVFDNGKELIVPIGKTKDGGTNTLVHYYRDQAVPGYPGADAILRVEGGSKLTAFWFPCLDCPSDSEILQHGVSEQHSDIWEVYERQDGGGTTSPPRHQVLSQTTKKETMQKRERIQVIVGTLLLLFVCFTAPNLMKRAFFHQFSTAAPPKKPPVHLHPLNAKVFGVSSDWSSLPQEGKRFDKVLKEAPNALVLLYNSKNPNSRAMVETWETFAYWVSTMDPRVETWETFAHWGTLKPASASGSCGFAIGQIDCSHSKSDMCRDLDPSTVVQRLYRLGNEVQDGSTTISVANNHGYSLQELFHIYAAKPSIQNRCDRILKFANPSTPMFPKRTDVGTDVHRQGRQVDFSAPDTVAAWDVSKLEPGYYEASVILRYRLGPCWSSQTTPASHKHAATFLHAGVLSPISGNYSLRTAATSLRDDGSNKLTPLEGMCEQESSRGWGWEKVGIRVDPLEITGTPGEHFVLVAARSVWVERGALNASVIGVRLSYRGKGNSLHTLS